MATNVTPRGYANVVIGGTGHTSSQVLTVNGTGSTNWATSNTATMTANGKLKVEGEEADIFINGKSLSDWMSAVEGRLSILQPRPELHDKYIALQEAYNHYKTLEALLYDDQKPNK
jgi:hypothetical protein